MKRTRTTIETYDWDSAAKRWRKKGKTVTTVDEGPAPVTINIPPYPVYPRPYYGPFYDGLYRPTITSGGTISRPTTTNAVVINSASGMHPELATTN